MMEKEIESTEITEKDLLLIEKEISKRKKRRNFCPLSGQ